MADKTYRNIIEKIALTKSSTITVFADFCRITACCLAAGTRENEYFEVIKSYDKNELNQFSKALALLIDEMESKPFTNILGTYYLDVASHSSKQARGEFYTPQEVSRLMAKISCDSKSIIANDKPITISEPTCGAGGMVLAIAELLAPNHVDLLRATCQDINPVSVDMCYINTTLWGIPATMIWGDTLRMTVNKAWKNIHWHRVGEDQRQTAKKMMQIIKHLIPEPKLEKYDITLPSTEKHPASSEQFEFDLELREPEQVRK